MKYFNFKNYAALILVFAFVAVGCKKTIKEPEPIGDAGQTLVKIIGGGTPAGLQKFAIDFVPTPTRLMAVQLRRDIHNETELAKAMVMTVKDDLAAVTAANPAYIQLSPATYSASVDGGVKTGGQGGTFTINFAPGEFAKEIYITIPDATVLSPSSLYGLGFTIMTADAGGIITEEKSLVIEIGAKNNFDGVYTDDFTNYHPTSNSGYTGGSTTIHMITTGANTCKMFWPLAGAFGNPSILGGGLSYFGVQEPQYTVTGTNVVVQNVAAGATTFYNMGTGYANSFNPATREINVRFGYSQVVPGTWDAGCREWTIKLTYVGPR